MTPVVIDADAFHCLRSFGLLGYLEGFCRNGTAPSAPLLCVGYVAHHELNAIHAEIERLVATGVIRVLQIATRSPSSTAGRELRQRHRGIDKGEAEAIAWLLTENPRFPFVSCDVRARRIAHDEGIVAWDPLDLVHEWIIAGVLSADDARSRLVSWTDDPHARWRPRDFRGVEETLRQRFGHEYLVRFEDR